ncbi:MAG: ThuA domain-containing protein, partial [Maribacter sp.]
TEQAQKLESNLLEYVKKGGGLVVLHGAVTMLNKSMDFSQLVGGSFDYHPAQQKIKIDLVDTGHPMVKAFEGKGFEHVDEPYIFNNAYDDLDFRPLLSMKKKEIEGLKDKTGDSIKYVSWIKKYGKGRVFYCSPSHNPQSYNNPQILQFILDAMQYAVGDLKCDDSPLK